MNAVAGWLNDNLLESGIIIPLLGFVGFILGIIVAALVVPADWPVMASFPFWFGLMIGLPGLYVFLDDLKRGTLGK